MSQKAIEEKIRKAKTKLKSKISYLQQQHIFMSATVNQCVEKFFNDLAQDIAQMEFKV